MKKTIYIHIGPHKTGTTTIQVGLLKNENHLKSKNILCPITGRPFRTSVGNHNLAWELLDPQFKSFDQKFGTWNDLLSELKNANKAEKIILSSEDFSTLKTNQVQTIQETLQDYKVKIIMYLRRQDEMLQSTWVEVVRNMGTKKNVESFFEWLKTNNYSSNNTNYLEIIKIWESVFSKENLILRIFDPASFQGSLLADFLFSCNIDTTNLIITPNENVSPGVKTIEAMRMIKKNITFQNLSKTTWINIVKYITEFGNQKNWNISKINYLSPKLSSMIMKYHKKTNKYIAKEYFQKDILFNIPSGKQQQFTEFLYNDFSNDELIELFSFIVTKFMESSNPT